MPDVEARQWSDRCHAAYVDLGECYPTFVGTAKSRPAALRLGRKVLREFGESPLTPTVSGRVSDLSEHACVGELTYTDDEPTCVNTPARLAPASPGATA